MDKLELCTPVNINSLEYTSKSSIAKYKLEFNNEYYIPPFELEYGIEKDLVLNGNYIDSAKKVGELYDIVIAINENDPYGKDNASMYRTHGRPIEGRTRYLSALEHKKIWKKVRYIKVKNFLQFIYIWSHFNSLKGGNTKDEKNKINQLCNYLYDVIGISKMKIGNIVANAYGHNHPFSNKKIYSYLLPEWFDNKILEMKRSAIESRWDKTKKMEPKKDVKIRFLQTENNDLIHQIEVLKEQEKDLIEKMAWWNDKIPFLTTPQIVILPSGLKVTISFDIEKKELVVK